MPPDIKWIFGLVVLFFLALAGANCIGCKPGDAKPAAYSAELAECNRSAQTLQDSIACEDRVRVRYGRPVRDAGGDR